MESAWGDRFAIRELIENWGGGATLATELTPPSTPLVP